MKSVLGIILAAGKGSRMKSKLPKVLHTVNGIPMVTRAITALEEAGATKIVVVVGYRRELVMETLGDRVEYVVQDKQQGTGHAVACAREHIREANGPVAIIYGDNPLLSSATVRKLIEESQKDDNSGALLTISLDNPPKAGRIVRSESGKMVNIIEDQDCTPEQAAIREINAGAYCFNAEALLAGLDGLKSDNSQSEYYLTDVPGILIAAGKSVGTVETDDVFEILGVNDRKHLAFAEAAKDIRYAESLYDLIDATLAMNSAPAAE